MFILAVFLTGCANSKSISGLTPTAPNQQIASVPPATVTRAAISTLSMTPAMTPLPSAAADKIIQRNYAIIQADNAEYVNQIVRYHGFELEDNYWGLGQHHPGNNVVPDGMLAVAFSPNNYRILFGSSNGAGIWNLEHYLTQPLLEESRPVILVEKYTNDVAFSPDGNSYAFGHLLDTPQLQIIPTQTCACNTPELGPDPVFAFAFNPDGDTMGILPDLGIWDWHGTSVFPQRRISLPPEYIPLPFDRYADTSIAFSPDGKIIATGGVFYKGGIQASTVYQGIIVLWDSKTGRVIHIFDKDKSMKRVTSLSFNSEGDLLLSDGEDGTVRLWNIENNSLLAKLEGTNSTAPAVVFGPNGSIFAAGNQDGTIRIWDAKTYQLLRTIQAHLGKTTGISFSFDGRFIASSGDDGTVGLWGVCAHGAAANIISPDTQYPCTSP